MLSFFTSSPYKLISDYLFYFSDFSSLKKLPCIVSIGNFGFSFSLRQFYVWLLITKQLS